MDIIIITQGDPGGISSEILIKSLIYKFNNCQNFFFNKKFIIFGSIESFIKNILNLIILNLEQLKKGLYINNIKETETINNLIKLDNFLEKITLISDINFLFSINKNSLSLFSFYDPFFEPIIKNNISFKEIFNNFLEKIFDTNILKIIIDDIEKINFLIYNKLEKILDNYKTFLNKNFYNFYLEDGFEKIKNLSSFKYLKNYHIHSIKKIINKNIFYVQYSKNHITNGLMSEIYLYFSAILSINIIKFGIKPSIITLPVSKKSISLIFNKFIGQTEYFQNFFKKYYYNFYFTNLKKILLKFNLSEKNKVNMIFYSDNFSLLLVTTHVPLLKLKNYINERTFSKALINGIEYFKKIYGTNGKIAVLALNPHASDNYIIGKEEKWIKKVIKKLNEENKKNKNNYIEILGPYPADSIFSKYSNNYDDIKLFISFYHDQGLIPFKILSQSGGVNISFGLPILRVSPDHGTAFDIVFKDKANIDSTLKCFEIIEKLNN